ncbi:hypothetical protein L6452_15817 [Arctium lappa]|uniref:Uncharacterized protein n=1 Tax=Arctium lappa TaxID=4217 RepID=A0ACB9CQ34_ARCLA|nr:hypothetical protein L6452_15817 [Arctium lappa]
MMDFIPRIAKLGYVWQFITLNGFHADVLIVDTFAKEFTTIGMAYVERIQREERNNGLDTLAHHKWSGANYYDRVLRTVQGGITYIAAMGKVTEEQFKETWIRSGTTDLGDDSIVIAKSRM